MTDTPSRAVLEMSPKIGRRRVGQLVAALAVTLFTLPAFAAGPSATDIAKSILESNGFSWDGAKTKMKMILVEKKGSKRERSMVIMGRRHKGRLQTVVRFRSPGDVAGTAFLMLEKKNGKSEQHIYLPGLKRTRRIVGRERQGSFMGSDFNYVDLRRPAVSEGKHKRLDDDKIGSSPTYVIESRPKKPKKAPYSKVVTWVRKSDSVPLRTRFYDKKGKLLKTLYARKIKKLEGRPVVSRARMENHQTGHATELVVESVERRDNLPDTAFTPTALEHQ